MCEAPQVWVAPACIHGHCDSPTCVAHAEITDFYLFIFFLKSQTFKEADETVICLSIFS